MDDDYSTEKFNSIRNEMSHIWGGIFVTGGGAITIVLTMALNPLQITFSVLGFWLAITLLNAYITRRLELLTILNELQKEK